MLLTNRIIELVFFFGLMGVVAFLVWQIFSPFVSALALAAIIVTVSYPLYEKITRKLPKQNSSLGALITTVIVFILVFTPFIFIVSILVNEAVSIYKVVGVEQNGVETSLTNFEILIQQYLPGFEINLTSYIKQGAQFFVSNIGVIFASTASTIFHLFIAMIGSFYLFRDGKALTKKLIIVSPLADDQDDEILSRMAISIRSVLTGTVLVALIQGVLTAFGLWLFGFERAVLWGTIASFGALIPGVGTSIIFIPSVLFLVFNGTYLQAIGLSIWGVLAVGLIDNLLGPYLMSRGNPMHPFIILLSVLGGIAFFGSIGFIVGPVIVTLLIVLLGLYSNHVTDNSPKKYD